MMTIQRFCERHGACREGREWAMRECNDMHDVWAKAKPEWLTWVATRPDVLTDSELRLFACWCARQVWHLLDDERSRVAVVVAERYAKGEVSDEELTAAREAAWQASLAAAEDAARATAWATAWAAARAAARATAWATAWAAAEDAQAEYLRKLTPNFG